MTLPLRFQKCPECGYDLSGTIASEIWRCPECGNQFSAASLREYWESPELQVLPPNELRVRGRNLFFGFLLLLLIGWLCWSTLRRYF